MEYGFEEKPKKKKKRSNAGIYALVIVLMLIIASAVVFLLLPKQNEKDKKANPSGTPTPAASKGSLRETTPPDGYGIVLEVDKEQGLLTYYDPETDKKLSIEFNGATYFEDDYGTQISSGQLAFGDMVEMYIDKENELLKSAVLPHLHEESCKAWEHTGVTGLVYNTETKTITFNGNNYHFNDGIYIISNGLRAGLKEIILSDRLTIRGVDSYVYEIIITKGHGYVILANEDDFVGGTLTIGNRLIESIVKNARYTVAEGTYYSSVSKGVYYGDEVLKIERNKTTVFDLDAYGKPDVYTTALTLDVEPKGAILYIDGVETEYEGKQVLVNYGMHTVEIALGGYRTFVSDMIFDSPEERLGVFLDESGGAETSGTSGSGNQSTSEKFDEYSTSEWTSVSISTLLPSLKINKNYATYILGPAGADIYINDEYAGKAPMDFEKIVGKYKIKVVEENGTTTTYSCTGSGSKDDTYIFKDSSED